MIVRWLLRPTVFAFAALLLGISFGHVQAAPLQTVSSVDLSAVTIDDTDLPGFTMIGEPAAMVPNGFAAAYSRVLYASDLSGTIVFVNLSAAGSGVAVATLQQAAANGAVLKSLTADQTKNANFSLTGPLGVGEADNAATWSGYDSTTAAWLSFYGDVFVRGRILVTVVYASAPGNADPAVIGRAAAAQDAKLVSSRDLPDDSGQ